MTFLMLDLRHCKDQHHYEQWVQLAQDKLLINVKKKYLLDILIR